MNIQLLIQKLKPILKTFDSDIAQKKLLGEKVFKIIKPYFDRLTTEQLASALITNRSGGAGRPVVRSSVDISIFSRHSVDISSFSLLCQWRLAFEPERGRTRCSL